MHLSLSRIQQAVYQAVYERAKLLYNRHILADPSRNTATNEGIFENIFLCIVLGIELSCSCQRNYNHSDDAAEDCRETEEESTSDVTYAGEVQA